MDVSKLTDGDLIIKGIGERERERLFYLLKGVINKPRNKPVPNPEPRARSNTSVSMYIIWGICISLLLELTIIRVKESHTQSIHSLV